MSHEEMSVVETSVSDDPQSEHGGEEEKTEMDPKAKEKPEAKTIPEAKTTSEAKTIPEATEYFRVEREYVDGQLVPVILPNEEVISEQWNDLEQADKAVHHGRPLLRGSIVKIATTQISVERTSYAIILDIRKIREHQKEVILIAYCATRHVRAQRKRGQKTKPKAKAMSMPTNAIEVFPYDVVADWFDDKTFTSKHSILDTSEMDTSRKRHPIWRKSDHDNVRWVAEKVQAVLHPLIQDASRDKKGDRKMQTDV